MNYYIGTDIGTSATKSVLFDKIGNVIGSFSKEYNIISPANGYAEQNPLDWFNATIYTLNEIGRLQLQDGDSIKGIGLSGQMHGLVLLDKDDNLLRNSIIWCDNRSGPQAELITKTLGEDKLREITKNSAMPAFTLAKLLWVKENEPEIYSKIEKVMLPKDYIRYKLTSGFYAEYSDVSGMQILDINTLEYSKEILDAFNIPMKWFAPLKRSDEITGYLTKEIELLTNLSTSIFVCGGAGDCEAGAIGNGIINSSDAFVVLGSSAVLFAPIDNLNELSEGLQVFCTAIKGKYHVMGVANGCGISFKWCRDNLFFKDYKELSEKASLAKCGSNNLIYLPYLLGERTPIMDNDATGVLFGIKNTTSDSEIIRSILEGVGYSLKHCFELINKKSKVLISGGGARSTLWKSIISSMIGSDLITIKQDEGPSLGVAILAMVANNEYQSVEEACKIIIKVDKITNPIHDWSEYYNQGFKIYKKLYQNNKDLFKELKQLKFN